MIAKRSLMVSLGGIVFVSGARAALPDIPMVRHEAAMRLAIQQAGGNPRYPFGAVIVGATNGELLAGGVNDSAKNPILHGEIACMNDYVQRRGNKDWASVVLYTTGEPCSMCMSALVWSGIGGVVYASSIDAIRAAGIDQIGIRAQSVQDASPFYNGTLLGGVLSAETDRMFRERKRD